MSFFGSLFGTPGGYDEGFKNQLKALLSQFGQQINQNYGGEGYRRGVSAYTNALQKNWQNWQAGTNAKMASMGHLPQNPLGFAPMQSALAKFMADYMNQMNTGKQQGLQTLIGLQGNLANVFYNQPKQGLFTSLAPILGAVLGGPTGAAIGSAAAGGLNKSNTTLDNMRLQVPTLSMPDPYGQGITDSFKGFNLLGGR